MKYREVTRILKLIRNHLKYDTTKRPNIHIDVETATPLL